MTAFTALMPIGDALRQLRGALREADIPDPGIDARILLEEAAQCDATALARDPQAPLGAEAARKLSSWLPRRLAGEPVGRILGYREFFGLRFDLAPATLEPRADTEALVELALRQPASRRPGALFLDLGTGSGCILLALLHACPDARGVGADRALGALVAARANAHALGLSERAAFVGANWMDPFREAAADAAFETDYGFDLIVSNPPYIPSATIATLDREVAGFDPRLALDGGADGLDPYRAICDAASRLLRRGGVLALEHGHDQEREVRRVAEEAGLEFVDSMHDLGGILRAQAFIPRSTADDAASD